MVHSIALLLLFCVCAVDVDGGSLYPRESESREVKKLDGIWDFRTSPASDQDIGFDQGWFSSSLRSTGDVIPMPVPSSYNDITQNITLRDYIGWVWYDREFFVPSSWSSGLRVFIRFGSAHYNTQVWVNGKEAVYHSGGHLPFEADVTESLNYGGSNRVTVAVNNTLTPETIPQGTLQRHDDPNRYPPGYVIQSYTFDFFNYAGIHRSVILYTTPETYVDDVTITTDIQDSTGIVHYDVSYVSSGASVRVPTVSVSVLDRNGTVMGEATGEAGDIEVENARLWWPYLMSDDPGYLYTLEVRLESPDTESDVYRLPFGIRTVSSTPTEFLINGRPFYFRGFGRHEDSDIRGKGLDLTLVVKDYNLIKWTAANSYRTSHYPYSEEIMDFADEQGIAIIDECPAVNTDNFGDELLANHKRAMEELIKRDKNRPSVVMWSVSNEPRTANTEAGPYFGAVINHTRSLDPTRPVTFVTAQSYSNDKAVQYVDVICFNRYDGWYSDSGHVEVTALQMDYEATQWNEKFNKPVMVAEYGGDAVSGIHTNPAHMWTEDFQVQLIAENHKAFDKLREKGFFVGEMVWNFADFQTAESTSRVVGNKKGIFTRERQPKASAHLIRKRYTALAQAIDNVVLA